MQKAMLFTVIVGILLSTHAASASMMMTGGMKHLDTQDPKLNAVLKDLGIFSVSHIQSERQKLADKLQAANQATPPLTFSFLDIKSAKSQVVAGISYHLELTMKNNEDSSIELCSVKVWEKKWMNFRQVSEFKCRPQRQSQKLLGARQTIRKDNEGAMDALNFGMEAINAKSNDLFFHMVHKVNNVFRQVVAGFKYIIEFESVASTCAKNDGKVDKFNLDECVVEENAVKRKCQVEVWDQPWMTPRYKLIGHKCE